MSVCESSYDEEMCSIRLVQCRDYHGLRVMLVTSKWEWASWQLSSSGLGWRLQVLKHLTTSIHGSLIARKQFLMHIMLFWNQSLGQPNWQQHFKPDLRKVVRLARIPLAAMHKAYKNSELTYSLTLYPHSGGDMHLRFTMSPDLGRTWGDSKIVVPSANRRSAWGPVLHYNSTTGSLHLFYAVSRSFTANFSNPGPSNMILTVPALLRVHSPLSLYKGLTEAD